MYLQSGLNQPAFYKSALTKNNHSDIKGGLLNRIKGETDKKVIHALADSLGAALLEFEALTGVGVVQRGEGACLGRVRLAAVGGQHAGDVAGTGVERRGRHRGRVEGAVQRLQERHSLVAWRDVLRRLQTRRGRCVR